MVRTRSRAAALLAAALLPMLATSARATITAEAQAVIERYLTATGGRAAFDAERSMHLRGRVTAFGLQGTVESWNERPDKSANLTSIGPLTVRDGYDGTTAWRIDQNGKLALRDGKDLEDARATAWFTNEMWGTTDQGGGSVALTGTERDTAGTWTVLEATPPAGRPRQLWFNVHTGLLERTVMRGDLQTVTSRMSDYRTVAGRLRSMTSVVTVADMPLNSARIEVDSIAIDEPYTTSPYPPPADAAGDARFLAGGTRTEVPFRYDARHVWLQASVNGGPLEDFLVDTGASITVIDSGYAARRGLKVEGRIQVPGAGQTGGASFARVDSIVVPGTGGGGIRLATQNVAVLSIDPYMEPFFWRRTAGVLGYDFISRFVMTVDYDHQRLVLEDPAGFQYQGKGQAVKLEMAGNIPVAEMALDDSLRGKFRLDVGSGSSIDLHSPFVAEHRLANRGGRSVQVMGGGFGGTFTSDLTRMKTAAIGPFSWDQPLVSLSHATQGGLASRDYAGNIGNQVLERFTVTFDYGRRTVWLEPGKRFTDPDRFSLAGVQLAREDGVVRALQVLPGSAADQAGLVEGDEVRKIDGRPIESWTLDQVTALFEEGKPGEKHTIEVMREGRKKKKLTLVLRAML
jgi:hypothetical protein